MLHGGGPEGHEGTQLQLGAEDAGLVGLAAGLVLDRHLAGELPIAEVDGGGGLLRGVADGELFGDGGGGPACDGELGVEVGDGGLVVGGVDGGGV